MWCCENGISAARLDRRSYRVCDALQLKCESEDSMTEIIVTKIVALWKVGEHDADRLANKVLNDLADKPA